MELRLVGVSEDGQQLVLADDSGDQHTLPIDDRLRAAVHGHLSRLGQLTMALESRISPREIQERVRSGESAEHVALTAGVPLERVLRFVGPVLREREHVVEQAQRARLAGTTGPSSLLADVVVRAATRQGIDLDELIWDSARREDHSWIVTVNWPDGTTAAWALDLARHQASPIDAAARRISGVADDTPIVLHASANLDADADASNDFDPSHDDDRDTIRLFVPRAVPAFDEQEPHDAQQVDDGPNADGPDDEEQAPSIEAASVEQPELEVELNEPSAPTPTPGRAARSSRRARVPKWDDIMFGPKSKD